MTAQLNMQQQWIERACLAEVIAPKPGNVSPWHAFQDTNWQDFVRSAEIVAPILTEASSNGVGLTIYHAATSVQQQLGKNTNLGIILLLAPLLKADIQQPVSSSISRVLDEINLAETELVFKAISLMNPGGLGSAQSQDVHAPPSLRLRKIMQLAEQRDLIARQYVRGFDDVIRWARALRSEDFRLENWQQSIVELQLRFLIEYPDSLIARKCGAEVAHQSSMWGLKINLLGGTYTPDGQQALREFHQWLTTDGNRKNPGTTADLIVATLYVAQRDFGLKLPTKNELLAAADSTKQIW